MSPKANRLLRTCFHLFLFLIYLIPILGCGSKGGNSGSAAGPSGSELGSSVSNSGSPVKLTGSIDEWIWVNGAKTVNQIGVYGNQGTAAAGNVPGAREFGLSGTDNNGHLWLFGGFGYDSVGNQDHLNDLWRFDGTNWTWMSGSSLVDQAGIYGNQGTAAAGNVPGAREFGVSWIDLSGHLWIFGGFGYDSIGNQDHLNDLWRFDGTNWTWMSGSNLVSQPGIYGTQGTAAPGNVPGSRISPVSWTDKSGNFWLFGGYGLDSGGNQGDLNDLWKFDGTNWTWFSGDNIINQPGIYGTLGIGAAGNLPGGRAGAVSWIDLSGNLWLFGGYGLDSTGIAGYLNDLWKFDGVHWTWVSGGNLISYTQVLPDDSSIIVYQSGSYGIKGLPAPTNVPGARSCALSWVDGSGHFWLFGGTGLDSTDFTTGVWLNDLWMFDGIDWTWVSGNDTVEIVTNSPAPQTGIYGKKGTGSETNLPGARYGSVSWIDPSGYLWLFGGNGYDSAGNEGDLNDLWRYQP